ncbi:MAG: hypothetical protein A2X02_01485 [Bacteroidetes bacterium GWF2_29_10]|nr:MAG: hypothetical protein A2X02_01485 [Bacteroidetes bacterium GWF2_29_10]
MKGVIVQCLNQLIEERFSKEIWKQIMIDSKLDPDTVFFGHHDINDAVIMEVVGNVCKNLNISLEDAANAFGDYWVNVFAKKHYFAFFISSKTARQFLEKMDQVHVKITETVPNAHPPRFKYETPDNNTIIMLYESKRGLIDFLVGLAKAVGTYYKEDIEVTKLDANKIKIVFK